MPQFLTFLLGLDLCWIIYELSLRIKFSLAVIQSQMQLRERFQTNVKSPERCIKLGRMIITLMLAALFTILTIILVVRGQTKHPMIHRK